MKIVLSYCLLFASFSSFAQDTSKLYLARAESMYSNIWNHFRVPKYKGLFSEHFPAGHSDSLNYFQGNAVKAKEVSFLWPFSGVFSATNSLLRSDSVKEKYLPFLDSCVIGVEYYRDTMRKPTGYQAYPTMFEKVDRYYDDNGLVGIDYMEAYVNTKNELYLQRAKEVFTFIISGWNDDAGGGVTWLEGHNDQKPACSNGTALLVALKIFEASKEKYYLDWGKRFYDWEYQHLRDTNGLYSNDKKLNGEVNRTFYTYNSGFMLEAATLLYKLTNNKKYLQHAQQLAKDTYTYFSKIKHDNRLKMFIDLPWFITVLFRGYEALYNLDGNYRFIAAIEKDLNYAWEHSKDQYGFITNNWLPDEKEIAKPKWLLDEACIAELYARLSLIHFIRKKSF
ncbi:MAG: glycoside hydrolase family 76 protein [Niabella sp.]